VIRAFVFIVRLILGVIVLLPGACALYYMSQFGANNDEYNVIFYSIWTVSFAISSPGCG